MGVEDIIKEVAGELERMVNTKTVVGEPITAFGKTIIPVSRISMGFGSGGGEAKKEGESGYGGGGGAGAKIEPVAFIVISEDETKIFRISEKNDLGRLLEAVPEIVPEVMGKIKAFKDKSKKETQEKEAGIEEKKTESEEKEPEKEDK